MNKQDIKTEEMLRAYFSRDCEEFSFKKKKKPRGYLKALVAAALVVAVGAGLALWGLIPRESEVFVYGSPQKTALANISENTGLCMPGGEGGTPTRVTIFTCNRKDLIYAKAISQSGDGKFLQCSDDLCESMDIIPDVDLTGKEPLREKAPGIEEKYEDIVSFAERGDSDCSFLTKNYGTNGFTLGYYNLEKTNDVVNLQVVYSDDTTEEYFFEIDYDKEAPVENAVKVLAINADTGEESAVKVIIHTEPD
ncbi:MAG: hypothetical protein ACI4GZ_01730 [Ruminococcus sp.]